LAKSRLLRYTASASADLVADLVADLAADLVADLVADLAAADPREGLGVAEPLGDFPVATAFPDFFVDDGRDEERAAAVRRGVSDGGEVER